MKKAILLWLINAVLMGGILAFTAAVTAENRGSVDVIEGRTDEKILSYTTYTVRDGDTLWDIAEDLVDGVFFITTQDVVKWIVNINNMDNPNLIKAGEKILIPSFL